MPKKEIVVPTNAPKANGPYSAANRYGDLVFTAGQLGIDPANGNLVEGGIEEQTRQALINLKNVLEAAGSSLDNVLKTTVYLKDIGNFGLMNGVYGMFFLQDFPARSAFEVAALPLGAEVEIEAVACLAN